MVVGERGAPPRPGARPDIDSAATEQPALDATTKAEVLFTPSRKSSSCYSVNLVRGI